MFGLRLPHAVPCVGDEHDGNLVSAVAVHQVPEALFGLGDGCPASYQHPIDVKQESEGGGALRRELTAGRDEQRQGCSLTGN